MTQTVACTPTLLNLGQVKPVVFLPAFLFTACGCLVYQATPAVNNQCTNGVLATVSSSNIASFQSEDGVLQFEVASGEADGGVCVAKVDTNQLPSWIKKKLALL